LQPVNYTEEKPGCKVQDVGHGSIVKSPKRHIAALRFTKSLREYPGSLSEFL
jgi:hypothetical protein